MGPYGLILTPQPYNKLERCVSILCVHTGTFGDGSVWFGNVKLSEKRGNSYSPYLCFFSEKICKKACWQHHQTNLSKWLGRLI
jgi:hypothetical protein